MCFLGYSTASMVLRNREKVGQVGRHRIKDDARIPNQRALNNNDNGTFRLPDI